jgi:hypothetical protein
MQAVKLDGLSFIPGPASDPPRDSLQLHDIIEHPVEDMASAFLSFPGMRLLNPGEPTLWEWQAEWRRNDSVIVVGMSLFDTDPVSWGGSDIRGSCSLAEILDLWNTVRHRCMGVWIHAADCAIYTPESFARLHGKLGPGAR